MTREPTTNSIQECIDEAIKAGRVKMRPRWYFMLRGMLFALGGILLTLTLLFLISLIIFSLRESGGGFGPGFGARGWFVFARSLPWLLVAVTLVFIIVLEFIAQRYPIMYRRPLLYSAAGILVLVIGGGFIIAGTSLHPRVMKYAERNELPIGQGFYRGIGRQEVRGVYPGLITATTTDGVVMLSRRGDLLMVTFTPETRAPFGAEFALNQSILVFGERVASDTVRAFGVRPIFNDFGY